MAFQKPLTLDQQARLKDLLVVAKENGRKMSDVARDHPEFKINVIQYWNTKWTIFNVTARRVYSEKRKLDILNYAKKHGVMEAGREYDVNNVTISEWNEKYKIYDAQANPPEFDKHFIQKVLSEISKYNLSNGLQDGVSVIAGRYNLKPKTIYNWNKKYPTFQTKQKVTKRKISPDDIARIKAKLSYFPNISTASRAMGYSKQTLAKINKESGK